MELKLWNGLLFCQCFCLKVIHVSSTFNEWTAETPFQLSALLGSCVVIPCNFKYPGSERSVSQMTGIWLTESYEYIYHPSGSVIDRFRGRTALVGDLGQKNCSLKLDPVKQKDSGHYFFRIEIHGLDNYSYAKNKTSVFVKDTADPPSISLKREATAGIDLSASCSVYHTCPVHPPTITWSHNSMMPTVYSEPMGNGQWNLTSVLTFKPQASDHRKTLTCRSEYRGRKAAENSIILNVTYAPVNVRMEFNQRGIKEGDSIIFRCSSDSNPPAHSYQWYNVKGVQTVRLQSERDTFTVDNVTRHSGAFYCTAQNRLGQSNSTAIQSNVEYAPEIKGSSCNLGNSWIICQCIVDSNPPAEIKWLFPDGTLLNRSSERQDSVTVDTLQGAVGFIQSISCYARNTHGNSTVELYVPSAGSALYVALPVSILVVAVIGAIGGFLLRRNRNRRTCDKPAPSGKSLSHEMHDPSYIISRRKIEDLEIPHYSDYEVNQHVYGNIEVDEEYENIMEEEIYANM
ncbi:sialic acid-binding Ig-like lectin 14 isoform X1 [Lepisosteus oculatus]|uniref:sialic acid-binding Ig-like lectin 14 isoform X1 n=1 Tax=Lepisosteus oculatus TaxID=7918 RepID=UPI0037188617